MTDTLQDDLRDLVGPVLAANRRLARRAASFDSIARATLVGEVFLALQEQIDAQEIYAAFAALNWRAPSIHAVR